MGSPAEMPPPPAALDAVAVCIATYQRPAQLTRLLDSLAHQQTTRSVRVIVVDNDPLRSAEAAVSPHGLDITLAFEPQPGIPAARNACLDLLSSEDDAVLFVDDDERVPDDWVERLCEEAIRQEVHIVAGPVRTILPTPAPWWIKHGGFHQRGVPPSGFMDGSPYTNNSFVTTSLLDWSGTRFDDVSFADTGGSDTDFFDRLAIGRGVPWYWCAEAEVFEDVPRDRLSMRWILRRGIRGGNVAARLQMRRRARWRVLLTGVALLVSGSAALPVVAMLRPQDTAMALALATRGVGMVGAVRGHLIREYHRQEHA